MVPLLNQFEVPNISQQGALSELQLNDASADYKWAFSNIMYGRLNALAGLAHLKNTEGVDKFSLLTTADAVGEGAKRDAENAADILGMELVSTETFTPGAPDVTPQLTNIGGAGAQAVFVYVSTGFGTIIKNFNTLQLQDSMKFMTLASVDNPAVYDELGDLDASFVNFIVPRENVIDQTPDDDYAKALTPLKDAYEAKSGQRVIWPAVGGANAVLEIANAARQVGSTDKAALRDQLAGGQTGFRGYGPVFEKTADNHIGLSIEFDAIARMNTATRTPEFVAAIEPLN
jgi:ABC-type branched-subunit amino acid transport system substrate-binding protein